jgi:TPP-dependent pyruvate/acetoin dehydrogenase alpha subunit
MNQEVAESVEKAVKFALDSPFPEPDEALDDVYA